MSSPSTRSAEKRIAKLLERVLPDIPAREALAKELVRQALALAGAAEAEVELNVELNGYFLRQSSGGNIRTRVPKPTALPSQLATDKQTQMRSLTTLRNSARKTMSAYSALTFDQRMAIAHVAVAASIKPQDFGRMLGIFDERLKAVLGPLRQAKFVQNKPPSKSLVLAHIVVKRFEEAGIRVMTQRNSVAGQVLSELLSIAGVKESRPDHWLKKVVQPSAGALTNSQHRLGGTVTP